LHIHHKIPWKLTENNSLENLMGVDAVCHKKLDSAIARLLKSLPENMSLDDKVNMINTVVYHVFP
jgi:hypothetical protein